MKITEGGGEYHLWLRDYGYAVVAGILLFMGSTVIMESCTGPEKPSPVDPVIEQQFLREAYLQVTGLDVVDPQTPREVYRQAAIQTFTIDAWQAIAEGKENLCAHYTDAIHILAPYKPLDIPCYTK